MIGFKSFLQQFDNGILVYFIIIKILYIKRLYIQPTLMCLWQIAYEPEGDSFSFLSPHPSRSVVTTDGSYHATIVVSFTISEFKILVWYSSISLFTFLFWSRWFDWAFVAGLLCSMNSESDLSPSSE